MKPILLPLAKKWDAVVRSYGQRGALDSQWTGPVKVGPYCDCSGGLYHAIDLNVTIAVLERLATSLIVDDNACYWQLTFRKDEMVLLSFQYNLIIGSRWVAILPLSEIPKSIRRAVLA